MFHRWCERPGVQPDLRPVFGSSPRMTGCGLGKDRTVLERGRRRLGRPARALMYQPFGRRNRNAGGMRSHGGGRRTLTLSRKNDRFALVRSSPLPMGEGAREGSLRSAMKGEQPSALSLWPPGLYVRPSLLYRRRLR